MNENMAILKSTTYVAGNQVSVAFICECHFWKKQVDSAMFI